MQKGYMRMDNAQRGVKTKVFYLKTFFELNSWYVLCIRNKNTTFIPMKKHLYFPLLIITSIAFSSNAQLPNLKKRLEKNNVSLPGTRGIDQDEVGRGLKEALNNGIEKGVDKLSVKDGYFKDDQILSLIHI